MSNKEKLRDQFFIDREGRSHKFKGNVENVVSIHYEIAKKIYPNADHPDDLLMDMGWILMGSSVYSSPIIHKKPTNKQIAKLERLGMYDRLCFLHDRSYPNYAKYGILAEEL